MSVDPELPGVEIVPVSGMALIKWRKARALELALAGLSFDAIADQLGYAGRSGAWKAVSCALSDTITQVASEYPGP
jgi:hypothetical protein